MLFNYDVTTDAGKVRLLLNDIDEATAVFDDTEIQAFLDMEGGSVKYAAAQAIDTNADNQALAVKVLKTQDLAADGAKVAQVLHQRAELLRSQAEAADFYFDVVDPVPDPYGFTPADAWPSL